MGKQQDTALMINVLSAGAVSPGLIKVLEAFRGDTGKEVNVTFATAPAIRKRIAEGVAVDILIAPAELLDELMPADLTSVLIGRIGAGVMVRDGAPAPRIATVEEFNRALLAADSVVYNQASTGTYLEGLFEKLGIRAELENKTTRYADFAAVRDHVANGTSNEIGLGATTVIIESKGVKFAGPLPDDIQHYTTYAAKAMLEHAANSPAAALLRFLETRSAKAILQAAGIV